MASESFTHAFFLLFLGLVLKISPWMPLSFTRIRYIWKDKHDAMTTARADRKTSLTGGISGKSTGIRNHSFHLSFICLNKGLSGRPQIGEVIRSHKVKNNSPFRTILQPHHPGAARSQDYLMFA